MVKSNTTSTTRSTTSATPAPTREDSAAPGKRLELVSVVSNRAVRDSMLLEASGSRTPVEASCDESTDIENRKKEWLKVKLEKLSG